uniref:Uncharacterized protein n=1 Tax=Anguilla anguilla TaxID=7936 RepID=A0A0E9QYM3_ANGAN
MFSMTFWKNLQNRRMAIWERTHSRLPRVCNQLHKNSTTLISLFVQLFAN